MTKVRFAGALVASAMMLGVAGAPGHALASNIIIDASGPTPVISGSDPWFFYPGFSSMWGSSSVTSIGANAWEIKLIFAGGSSPSFGSGNRGLDLVDPQSGRLLDSFSFNYMTWSWSYDLVLWDAYLFTADASGVPAVESARCPTYCITSQYSGKPQLVISGMHTDYTNFDVYLVGTPMVTPSVPEPGNLALFGTGLAFLASTVRRATGRTRTRLL